VFRRLFIGVRLVLRERPFGRPAGPAARHVPPQQLLRGQRLLDVVLLLGPQLLPGADVLLGPQLLPDHVL